MKRHFVLTAGLVLAVNAVEAQTLRYVGSTVCAECHEQETQAWSGSHHDLAWTEVADDTVRAEFDGTAFALRGMSARFSTNADGARHISVTELDGRTTEYPVHSVVGVEPLQQYLLETEPGRLQSFDVVWDTERGDWFHLYPNSELPPSDALHWTGPYKNWNARCAECHATGFEKAYESRMRSYRSTQAEIGVGCEACHGPGADHVAWASETTRTPPPDLYGFSVDFSDTEAAIQQCATCHSRREAHLDSSPLPGTPYHDSYNLALLRPGLYEADGQILDEVYVYGSFLQSKMYAMGVGCIDCHDAHSAERVAKGNAVCTQCHNPAGNPRFPTLTPASYDDTSHHFHEAGTDGALCKSCHMAERVYMGNDWRADHSFRIPRPDLADAIGAPDACTTCHTDQDPEWAAARLVEWFPASANRGPHYGEVLARGRENPVLASADLVGLSLDAAQPGIVRATALWLLEDAGSPVSAKDVAPALSDTDPLVRAAAAGPQRMAAPQDRVLRLLPLLEDPVRNVRIAAARALIDAPVARLPAPHDANLRGAITDWQGSLSSRLDFPETHLQIAGTALTTRNFEAAIGAFREVVQLDPQRVEAWVMLVRIGAALGASADTLRDILDDGLEVNPGDPTLDMLRADLEGASGTGSELLPPRRQ